MHLGCAHSSRPCFPLYILSFTSLLSFLLFFFFFFFNDTATTEIYTLSLHDALPIYRRKRSCWPGRWSRPSRCSRHRSRRRAGCCAPCTRSRPSWRRHAAVRGCQVEVGFAAALFGEAFAGHGIESLKRAEETSKLDVHQVAVYLRIKRNFGLDIGMQVRRGVGAGAQIDLRVGVRSGKQAGQNDRASAGGTAAVLVGSLQGESHGHYVAGVVHGAELG